jgi:hypothetical protein
MPHFVYKANPLKWLVEEVSRSISEWGPDERGLDAVRWFFAELGRDRFPELGDPHFVEMAVAKTYRRLRERCVIVHVPAEIVEKVRRAEPRDDWKYR